MAHVAAAMQREVDGLRGSGSALAARSLRERARDARGAAADRRSSDLYFSRADVEQSRIDGLRRTLKTCHDDGDHR